MVRFHHSTSWAAEVVAAEVGVAASWSEVAQRCQGSSARWCLKRSSEWLADCWAQYPALWLRVGEVHRLRSGCDQILASWWERPASAL